MKLKDLLDRLAPGIIAQLCFDGSDLPDVRFTTAMKAEADIFSSSALESDVNTITIDSHGILVLNLVFCGSASLNTAEAGKAAVAGYQDGLSCDSPSPASDRAGKHCMSCDYFNGEHTCKYDNHLTMDAGPSCEHYLEA